MRDKAFIFAAGLGTRLYPLTANRPKALVKYDGIPLLQRVLDKVIAAGITDIVVNVHHFPDQIIEFLKGHPFSADIRVSDERAYLRDTAGGVRFATPLLGTFDRLLLYNVDILSSIDIRALLRQHTKMGADVTLAVRQRKTSRYLVFDRQSMTLRGWRNITTGEVLMPGESDDTVDLAFSGIHVVNPTFVAQIPSVEKSSLTPLYVQLVNKIHICGYQHDSDEWMDVGKYSEQSNHLM